MILIGYWVHKGVELRPPLFVTVRTGYYTVWERLDWILYRFGTIQVWKRLDPEVHRAIISCYTCITPA